MTDIDHVPLLPEPPLQQPGQQKNKNRISAWPRIFVLTGVLVGGLALGAGGFALAAGELDHMGWKHGPRLAMVQAMVSRALDSVGASAEQEAKVHDIVAAKFADIAPDPKEHLAMRKQALDLLPAPTIDRAAVEKLRADDVAHFDAKSKVYVAGILDVADQLTPPQRAELAARIEEMAPRGPMGGWGGPHRGPPMDGGPDNGPDKD